MAPVPLLASQQWHRYLLCRLTRKQANISSRCCMSHAISRRGFVRITSSLAAGAALSGLTRGLCAADAQAWGGWPIGIQSYSLREYNVHDAIRHIQGMG